MTKIVREGETHVKKQFSGGSRCCRCRIRGRGVWTRSAGAHSDTDAGGNGFQHHRTGDPISRTTWMMVLGPGIRENVVVDRPVESTDLVPTLGSLFGFNARFAQGKPLPEVL